MSSLQTSNLFKPLTVSSSIVLKHRLVHAPTTRFRATKDHIPSNLQLKYYDDRSKTPGSLIITEATFISPAAGGYFHAPGIWSDKQVKGWRKIADKVHENGSFLALQLWALGRQAEPDILAAEKQKFVSSTDDIYLSTRSKKAAIKNNIPLKALTVPEIKQWTQDYATAAKNAISAGADIVELHGANGYLIDQFLQECTNKRSDEYGGSIENRAKFLLEIIDSIIEKIGDAKKVAIRLSPWSEFGGMAGITEDPNTLETFKYVFSEFQKRADNGKSLAYISIVEPSVNGHDDVVDSDSNSKSNNIFLDIWKGTVIRAGGYLSDPAHKSLLNDVNSNDRTLIAAGRYFLSNPDLVDRLRNKWPLTKYDRSTFYAFASNNGYNVWPTYNQKIDINEIKDQTSVALA
ncbi:alkene reductase [Ascoidea rubescens DSM 1968]|uniref:NADH:flavin oxidoreductase/NADH oxidase n=1 Tax=Ascoidea rubescens DSM 1968 TaxID=1344418 RepID=A0A1D2V9Q7_9ASCO|nr:NADH:flavin oxidoreductase/NADH oxidase [Ascoidea rubescens DSM 1968]ODV58203.1 NADH:flavin oxidoreductase/NADH oxidase [Ascoidea rubescens DSM 1968]